MQQRMCEGGSRQTRAGCQFSRVTRQVRASSLRGRASQAGRGGRTLRLLPAPPPESRRPQLQKEHIYTRCRTAVKAAMRARRLCAPSEMVFSLGVNTRGMMPLKLLTEN